MSAKGEKVVVKAAEGAAVVTKDYILAITGSWTAEELTKVFDAMDTLGEKE